MRMESKETATVAIVMGSTSDWTTLCESDRVLSEFEVPHICKVVSAHRTPDLLHQFAEEAADNGIKVIIAGAGGAAHLPGMIASKTLLPVLGVPVQSKALNGLDSLLSIVQMPGGIPVPTFSIGKPGAINAALSAVSILALEDANLMNALKDFRKKQTDKVLGQTLPPREQS